ncbi:MAG TPA: EAL domain-containing protein, partial [Alicycliphilus sp.]|nr:EAL domain-containing protein [Alicycliphilus sp.]
LQERLQGRTHSARYERPALRADGSKIEIEIFGTAMTHQGRPAVIGLMIDITERKRAEMSARRAALVYQHTTEAMVVTDDQGVVQDINPAFTAITGYEATDIIGRRMNLLSSGRQDRAFYQALWARLKETGSWSGDICNRRKSGEEYMERLTISTSYQEDGSVHSHIGLFADVTEKRRREASIWQQAHFDHLTGLPNRQMFQQNLQQGMEQSRASGLPLALVFLDLDLFKEVNDSLGHDAGDELLRQVARRLQACVRRSDQVARLGGDEFTLILRDLKHPADAHPICRKVLQAVAQPYELSSGTVQISVSAGVTCYPRDGDDSVALLKHADLAMYAAKDKGRNQFCEFTPSMEQDAQDRRLLLRDLRQGLDEGEFTLHYQPIVHMQSGRTVKAEALLRWNHSVRGQVSPAQFIPLAEESGLILPLGDWVFQEATRQLAQWRTELDHGLQISVNVSPVQLQSNKQQPQAWLQHLHARQLPSNALVMELTESVLMEADKETGSQLQALQALQAAGMELALDDFGTGYSSLSYLKRLDIDYLKIDRSFVNQLTPGNEDNVLCEAIIVMAHQLGIRVVAEGVETQEQHDILRAAGCDYGQGYWYCRPVSAADFGARLREERARHTDTDAATLMAAAI